MQDESRVSRTRSILEHLVYPESPRWHDDALWFTDIPNHHVVKWSPDSGAKVVLDLAGNAAGAQLGPSGLGFLPDGTGVVAMMSESGPLKGKVIGFDSRRNWIHADLSPFTDGRLNDMVVGEGGDIYVGALDTSQVLHISPAGQATVALSGFASPNGMVIMPDRQELRFVAHGSAIYTAAIRADRSLGNARLWADFSLEATLRRQAIRNDRTGPITWEDLDSLSGADGIAADVEGGVWVGGTSMEKFIRVEEGGFVTDVIRTPGRYAIACHLGGPERRTLFMTTAESAPGTPRTGGHGSPGLLAQLTAGLTRGRIDSAHVAIPGAGWP